MRKKQKLPRLANRGFLLPGMALALMVLVTGRAWAMAGTESSECVVGGCSGQLCVESSKNSGVGTCEYAARYACYPKVGECKRQADGVCGWSQTEALKACLANPPGIPGTPPMPQ